MFFVEYGKIIMGYYTYKIRFYNLFAFNQVCVLSNGLETRLGAFNALYSHYFEWLKTESEKERPDRKAIREAAGSQHNKAGLPQFSRQPRIFFY